MMVSGNPGRRAMSRIRHFAGHRMNHTKLPSVQIRLCCRDNHILPQEQRMRTIIILAFCFLLFSALSGCNKETEQEKVKKVIETVQKAAEEKEIKKITGSISKTYSDSQGNNHAALHRMLIGYFYQFPKIAVYISNLTITVQNETATARFEAVLTSKGADPSPAILPESLGVYSFDVQFRKESGEWAVVSAQWERIGDADKR